MSSEMTGHTKGPLTIQADAGLWSVVEELDPTTFTAAYCTKADATLYAAAPDLLEAAVEFCRKVDAGEARSTRSYAAFKAAIRKALNPSDTEVGG